MEEERNIIMTPKPSALGLLVQPQGTSEKEDGRRVGTARLTAPRPPEPLYLSVSGSGHREVPFWGSISRKSDFLLLEPVMADSTNMWPQVQGTHLLSPPLLCSSANINQTDLQFHC